MKIQLGVAFTDTSMPVIRNDRLLTHGSLTLITPQHGMQAWPAGVPANGVALPNIAADEAAALGIADPGVGAVVGLGAGLTFERTAKGGLHGIVPQAVAPAVGAYMSLNMSPGLKAYILANPAHSYFLSLRSRTTRLTASGTNSLAYSLVRSVANSTLISLLHSASNGTGVLGRRNAAVTNTDPVLRNIANSNGVITGYAADASASLATWGRIGPFNSGVADAQRLPSWIFYQAYLEDLTVSGRTYAQVDALDAELFGRDFGVGGKFYGDTFTSPSTVP
jgi:hypothetical protein